MERQKGKLTKSKKRWFVLENKKQHLVLIYETEYLSENAIDIKLSEKFNKPIIELEGLDVEWDYLITDSITNFGNEYAVL